MIISNDEMSLNNDIPGPAFAALQLTKTTAFNATMYACLAFLLGAGNIVGGFVMRRPRIDGVSYVSSPG